jgi:hypothetical protein
MYGELRHLPRAKQIETLQHRSYLGTCHAEAAAIWLRVESK